LHGGGGLNNDLLIEFLGMTFGAELFQSTTSFYRHAPVFQEGKVLKKTDGIKEVAMFGKIR